ncbi:MAG: cupin domain-containing protein [Gaiellaceae bacterium MAG52_C11]|nr:cupin domain-containing protein [Candidatus Gaiellasilicea maunaloa]
MVAPRSVLRVAPALAVLVVAIAGCGGDGGGGLGGSADVVELAATELEPAESGPLVWMAEEFRLDPGETLEHVHEFAFAYARAGTHMLGIEGERRTLEPGRGAVVPARTRHRHQPAASTGAGSAGTTLWEIRLAAAGAPATPGARRIFRSEPLEGIPKRARASFLLVRIPPGGETSVHTHPGPELIYQVAGRILYQNALIGTVELGPGGLEGIPPGTPVQKRNRSDADAEFLSWFLVDPAAAFAPGAEFRSEGAES